MVFIHRRNRLSVNASYYSSTISLRRRFFTHPASAGAFNAREETFSVQKDAGGFAEQQYASAGVRFSLLYCPFRSGNQPPKTKIRDSFRICFPKWQLL